MRNDLKSNYEMIAAIVASSVGVSTVNSASADHSLGGSASFLLSVGDVGAAGTVDAKLQNSDDGVTWVDNVVDGAGNDTAIAQVVAAGDVQLNVTNPIARYSRVVVTVGANACVLSVTSVLGPLRHVAP